MMHFYRSLICLSFLWALSAQAATDIQINSPADGEDLRTQTTLELTYTVNDVDVSDAKIVVFRMNNHAWPRVQEIPMNTRLGGHVQNVIPAQYFCEDLYAIRIMSGERTLAGPVHFNAGTGACSSTDRNKFLNMEQNMIDLLIYKPANQSDRDTCVAFATAAALSAAYRREKGVNILLSQNFLHHMVKSTSYSGQPFYLYENQTAIWGGNNLRDGFKILKHYAAPSDVYAPYMTNAQLRDLAGSLGLGGIMFWNANPAINRIPQLHVDLLEYNEQHISILARQLAMYGIKTTEYWRGKDATDTNRIENLLRAGREVIIGMDLLWQDAPKKAKTKIYNSTSSGAHMMVIVGYDKTDTNNSYFLVKNSYGDGILRLHYDIIRKQTNSEIGVITSVRDVNTFHPTRWIGEWQMKHDRWIGKLYIRRAYELAQDKVTGYSRIGEYQHQNGQRYCAYGSWDTQAKKLLMKINFDTPIQDSYYNIKWNPAKPAVFVLAKDVCGAEAKGQNFELNMANNINRNAWGSTIWNGYTFPAEIWR